MARFLITVWPLAGHLYPNLALAHALRSRGHEVCFYTGFDAATRVQEQGFQCFPFRRISQEQFDRIMNSYTSTRWKWKKLLEKRAAYREFLVGTLEAQVEDLNELLNSWTPDVLICDPMMWGPYVVLAETRQITVAIFAYVPFCLVPSPEIPVPGLGLPPPRGWLSRLQARLGGAITYWATANIRREADEIRRRYSLAPLSIPVSELAGRMPLYLVAGTPEFDYGRKDVPPSVHYVGPCLPPKTDSQPPAEWLATLPADRPLVHITEGTVHSTAPLVLSAAARGLANLSMHVVMATGTHRRPADMGLEPLAPNIRVERWVNYNHLLPRTDLVVTTAGAGTVLATLEAGIPMVLIPTEWDKPEVARRVAEAGAGLLLKPERCRPKSLRVAVERVLSDPAYRKNARRLAASFTRYRGPSQAADLLETLVPATNNKL